MNSALAAQQRPPLEQSAIDKLMGLAVHGEKVAARIYSLMAELSPDHRPLLRHFASMEGQHGAWFAQACKENGIVPDRAFADRELGYLISQVEEHFEARNLEALAVVQGFIVESLAIATYEPYLEIADRYPGTRQVFAKALAEEHYHVDWVVRFLRLRFFDREQDFMDLAARVNVQGIDCVGGTMMNIAASLDTIGLSGADCAGAMMDGYTGLLESVGVEPKKAAKNVVALFMPLVRKYRHGERTK